MKIELSAATNPFDAKADGILLFVPELPKKGKRVFGSKQTVKVSALLEAALTENPGFNATLGDTATVASRGELPAKFLILAGLGKAPHTMQAFRRAAAAAARVASRLKLGHLAISGTILEGGHPHEAAETVAQAIVEGVLLGAYRFSKYKDNSKTTLKRVALLTPKGGKKASLTEAIETGRIVATHVNNARDWVFDSPHAVTPSYLATEAKALAKQHKNLSCTVLNRTAMEKHGMGGLLFVSQGSAEEPALIHLSLKPSHKKGGKKVIGLVGKGVTFDSGGLSLKPSKSMELMKMDMAGAAAVIQTMGALAELDALGVNLPWKAIHAVAPATENMPGGHASRPGDVYTAMNGKTVEVNNTDAEGRLILADALTYLQREAATDVAEIIDLATLTGACVVALGKVAAGIMGNDEGYLAALQQAGAQAGEKFWPLPLYDEYKDKLKSDVADLINSGSGGEAGTPYAAMFLKEFIDEAFFKRNGRWAHMDIAGPAWTSADVPEVPKGATGFGVRTLLAYLLKPPCA